VRGGDPILNQFPCGVLECERFSVDLEVRLKNGRAFVAADLEQAAMVHGENVEGAESAVTGTDVRKRDPLIAGGENVVGAEGDRCANGCGGCE
jgi:hypothetical protein